MLPTLAHCACAAAYQPTNHCSQPFMGTPSNLCSFFTTVVERWGAGRGGLRDVQNSQACKLCLHISFRCVVWKKGLFMNSNFSYCSLLNLTTQNQTENVWGLPGQLDLNLHFTTVELKIWYGINQIHVLITSLTINPCCTSLLVQMLFFPY